MRFLVHGFADAVTAQVIPQLLAREEVEQVDWILDAAGRELVKNPRLTVIDHLDALHPPGSRRHDAETGEALPPVLRQLYQDLWPKVAIMQDRLEKFGPSLPVQRRRRIYRRLFFYWLEALRERRISHYVGSNIAHEVTDFVIAGLCRALDIPTLFFFQWRTDAVVAVEDYRALAHLPVKLGSTVKPQGKERLRSVLYRIKAAYVPDLEGETEPFYMRPERIARQRQWAARRSRRRLRHRLRSFLQSGIKRRSWRYLLYLTLEKPLLRPYRDRQFLNRYQAIAQSAPDLSRPYVYLALHYQPEATTSPLAGSFVEQYRIAELLIDVLPPEVYLYVKEHPAQRSLGRAPDYYDRFPDSDRLLFVGTEVDSQSLLANARAVATATGTVGFEAMWKGKPALVFGYAYYATGPGVYRISDAATARAAIEEIFAPAADYRSPSTGWKPAAAYTEQLCIHSLPVNLSDYYANDSSWSTDPELTGHYLVDEIMARAANQ